MVTSRQILRFISAEPYRPFRIRVKEGRTFDINDPDSVMVSVSRVFIARFHNDREDENPHDFEFLPSSIEAIEPIFAESMVYSTTRSPGKMVSPQTIQDYVKAEPFRPFRLHLASGRTFDVRHPEMIKLLKSCYLLFKTSDDASELQDGWESVSFMLTESISHLETAAR